jgi:HSP20 family molecular chaperone IbpA
MNSSCCGTAAKSTNGASPVVQSESQSSKGVSFFKPAVDVAERPDAFVVQLDVPGARSESLDIAFEKGELTVTARVEPRTAKGARLLMREYDVGDYQRTFRLSEAIDPSSIEATLANGVLTVRLPKAPHAQPRRIQVRTA